jgi:hypothetical protein
MTWYLVVMALVWGIGILVNIREQDRTPPDNIALIFLLIFFITPVILLLQ